MKIAVSIPDPIFSAAEALAVSLNKPRSQLYAEAIAQFVGKHSGASITERLNEVHDREGIAIEEVFLHAQSKILIDETW
jgi:predicted transcriptional regulator